MERRGKGFRVASSFFVLSCRGRVVLPRHYMVAFYHRYPAIYCACCHGRL